MLLRINYAMFGILCVYVCERCGESYQHVRPEKDPAFSIFLFMRLFLVFFACVWREKRKSLHLVTVKAALLFAIEIEFSMTLRVCECQNRLTYRISTQFGRNYRLCGGQNMIKGEEEEYKTATMKIDILNLPNTTFAATLGRMLQYVIYPLVHAVPEN